MTRRTVDSTDPRLPLLMSDGLSEYDLTVMTEIVKEGHGNWYHAKLLRALHALMPAADEHNLARLRSAYPGSTMAYELWYNSTTLDGIVQTEEVPT